jgi:hypothetical protein
VRYTSPGERRLVTARPSATGRPSWRLDRYDRAIVAIGLVLLVGYLAGSAVFAKPDGRVVFGDATHHFVQLRSLVFDRDVHFQNEYVRVYGLGGDEPGTEWVFSELTPTGYVRNYMPVGPALLWAPLYLTVAAVLWALAAVGLAPAPDGFEWLLQLTPGITGIVAVTGAALASWRMVARLTNGWNGLIGVVAVWLGSHALYYSLVSPSYSHTASMLASALFFVRWTAGRRDVSLRALAEWGVLAGLAALMRWQEAVLIVIPLLEAARWHVSPARRAIGAAATALACAIAFLPQMAVWTVLYGQPLALPQGSSFMQWTAPHLVDVLISDNHGLFTWAPMLVLAAIGFGSFAIRHPALGLPMALVMVTTWYVNAAVADWWAGEAFGARRFLSLFPLFALGLANWLSSNPTGSLYRWKVRSLVLLTVGNGLLLFQYELFMKGYTTLAPYPRGWTDMWLTRLVVPFRLLESWLW